MDLERGGAWPSYSFGCGTSAPNGCLLNPEGSRLIFLKKLNIHQEIILKYMLTFSIQITLESLPDLNPLKNSMLIQHGKSGTNSAQRDGRKPLITTGKNILHSQVTRVAIPSIKNIFDTYMQN